MKQEELESILGKHKAWLGGEPDGERADLHEANLRGVDLHGANLFDIDLRLANLHGVDLRGVWLFNANLQGADLGEANLRYACLHNANLQNVNLHGADLRGAHLQGADLRGAELRNADLHGANLRYANLRGANLDFSSWPLWCGSLNVKVDRRIAVQLLYHALNTIQSCADDPDVAEVLSSPVAVALANQFHRVRECGRIEEVHQ